MLINDNEFANRLRDLGLCPTVSLATSVRFAIVELFRLSDFYNRPGPADP